MRKRLPHNFLILRDELLLCKRERGNKGTTDGIAVSDILFRWKLVTCFNL